METRAEAERGEPRADEDEPRARWPLYLSGGLLLALVALYVLWPPFGAFLHDAWDVLRSGEEQRIEAWVARHGGLGPLVIVGLMVLQLFLVVVPSWLLMVIAVLAYGGLLGGLLAIGAVAVASAVGYGLGRLLGDHGLDRWLSARTRRRLRRETDRYGVWAVVVARLNPLLSNDGISLVGGALRLGFLRFMAATLAGITPLAVAIGALGRDWERMRTGLLWLSLVSLAALGAKVWHDRRHG